MVHGAVLQFGNNEAYFDTTALFWIALPVCWLALTPRNVVERRA